MEEQKHISLFFLITGFKIDIIEQTVKNNQYERFSPKVSLELSLQQHITGLPLTAVRQSNKCTEEEP